MSQFAACEALFSAKKDVENMFKEYKRRRDFFMRRLKEIGLDFVKPQGAFYIFVSLKNTGFSSSLDFAKKLLEEKKVAVVPGVAFGENYADYIRISYATSFENLKLALERIEEFIKKGR